MPSSTKSPPPRPESAPTRHWAAIIGRRLGPLCLLLLITLLAAGARFSRLGSEPLWWDEIWTLEYSQLPYRTILLIGTRDVHPPVYYVLTRLWLYGVPGLGFGGPSGSDDEWALRAPAAILGVLTVPLVFAFGRSLGGTQVGLLTALLFAVAPYQVRYAQEARMYTLLTFGAVLALWALSDLIRRSFRPSPQRDGDREGAQVPPLIWFSYCAGMTIALYSHNMALLLWAACNVAMAVALAARSPRSDRLLKRWSGAQLVVALSWLPVLPFVAFQSLRVLSGFWISAPTASEVADAVRDLHLGPFLTGLPSPSPWWVAPGATLFWVALLVAGLRALGKTPQLRALILIVALVPVLAELAISAVRPVFITRTLIWTALPSLVVIAVGALSFRSRPARALAVLSVVGFSIWGVAHNSIHFRKEAWNRVAAHVARSAGTRDEVLFYPARAGAPFNYYFRRTGRELIQRGLPGDPADAAAEISRKGLASGRDFWLVTAHTAEDDVQKVLSALEAETVLVETENSPGVTTYRFRARGPEAVPPVRN